MKKITYASGLFALLTLPTLVDADTYVYYAAEKPPTDNIPTEAPLCYKFKVLSIEQQVEKLKKKYPSLFDYKIENNLDGSKNLTAKRFDDSGNLVSYFYSTSPGSCNKIQENKLLYPSPQPTNQLKVDGSKNNSKGNINCSTPSGNVDDLICSNPILLEADESELGSFETALAYANDKKEFVNDQIRWLSELKRKCIDVFCIKEAYDERLEYLEQYVEIEENTDFVEGNEEIVPVDLEEKPKLPETDQNANNEALIINNFTFNGAVKSGFEKEIIEHADDMLIHFYAIFQTIKACHDLDTGHQASHINDEDYLLYKRQMKLAEDIVTPYLHEKDTNKLWSIAGEKARNWKLTPSLSIDLIEVIENGNYHKTNEGCRNFSQIFTTFIALIVGKAKPKIIEKDF